jgi:hypothetical protein
MTDDAPTSGREHFENELRSRLAALFEPQPLEAAVDAVPDLVAWVLEHLDAAIGRAQVLADAGEGIEKQLDLVAAGTRYTMLVSLHGKLEQIEKLVARGMTISQSSDLARTLDLERADIRRELFTLMAERPEIAALVTGGAVTAEGQTGLVGPDGSPLQM